MKISKIVINVSLIVCLCICLYLLIPTEGYEDIIHSYESIEAEGTSKDIAIKRNFAKYKSIQIEKNKSSKTNSSNSGKTSSKSTWKSTKMSGSDKDIIQAIMDDETLSQDRKDFIAKGASILGTVDYAQLRDKPYWKMESPVYLDCSMFIAWCCYQTFKYLPKLNTREQWRDSNLAHINEKDLIPGDLGYKNQGGDGNHVAIFLGYNKNGEKLWLHVSSGKDNRKDPIIGAHSKLVYYRRLPVFK